MIRIILLGLSVSIDSWAVGAAYHAEDIKIPWMTKLIVAFISAATSLAAVFLGNGLGRYMDTMYLQEAGGLVLALIGVKSLWEACTRHKEKNYDVDASKTIEPLEGIVLGGVLASDSFSAGFSLCSMGTMSYLFPGIVGVLTCLFLVLADRKIRRLKGSGYIAGGALVILGLFQAVSAAGIL